MNQEHKNHIIFSNMSNNSKQSVFTGPRKKLQSTGICESCDRFFSVDHPCVVHNMTDSPIMYPSKHRSESCAWYGKKENMREVTYEQMMHDNASTIKEINDNKDNYEPLQ